MRIIKQGTISSTTTISLGESIDPSKYMVNISTNACIQHSSVWDPVDISSSATVRSHYAYGYGNGAWWSNKTSTSVTINVSAGITASYEIIKI